MSSISYVEGTYHNNVLCGPGKITHLNGDVLCCIFGKGYVNGPTKLYDKGWVLKEVCWYHRNVPYGIIWKFLIGGGFLLGQVDTLGVALFVRIRGFTGNLGCAPIRRYHRHQLKDCPCVCY